MLTEDTRKDIAEQILDCYLNRKQIPLLTQTYPDIEIEDSYRIQEYVVEARIAAGRVVKGYKVGLTSKAMQELAGTDEPDFSAMLDDMFIAEGSTLKASDWCDPLVEQEIAFVMKEKLTGPNINAADVIRATDFVLPAIELVDFRVNRVPGLGLRDTVADLAAVGAVILGGNPMRLEDIDVREIAGELIINDEVQQSGMSSAVLGNPISSIAWLANKLSEFGVTFGPGDVILSGSFIKAMPVKAGDSVIARFDNGFGDVCLSFE